MTCPLITKADGGKFGKTESGNIWLSPKYTSPYKFYQFWLNVSNADAKCYIKIFTSLTREEIESLIAEHDQATHMRVLQKRLAKEVTCMVHSEADYTAAVEASNILFGNTTHEALCALSEEQFLEIFEGVERYEISLEELRAGIGPLDLLDEKTTIFPSKGEARKMIQANGFSMNKEKLTDPQYTSDHEAVSSAIALSGFTSDQTFYRIFKELTGQTPLQFRRQNMPKM